MATPCAGPSDTGPILFDNYGVPSTRAPRGKRRFGTSPGPESHQLVGSWTLPHEHEALTHEANTPTAKRSRVKEEHHDAHDYQHYSAPYCSPLGSWPWNILLVNQGLQGGNHVASVWPSVVQAPPDTTYSPYFSGGWRSFPLPFPLLFSGCPEEVPISSSVTQTNEPSLLGRENAPRPISFEAAPAQFNFSPVYEEAFDHSSVLIPPPSNASWFSHNPPFTTASGHQLHLDLPNDITAPTPQVNLRSSPTQSMSPSSIRSTYISCNSPPTLKSESSYGSSFDQSERSPCVPNTPADDIITPVLIDKDAAMSFSFHEVEPMGQCQSTSLNSSAILVPSPQVVDLADSWALVGKLEDDSSPKLAPVADQILEKSYVDVGKDPSNYRELPQAQNGRVGINKELPPCRKLPQVANCRKKRCSMGEEERKGIFYTRKIGACLRCHMQRTKCVPSSDDPLADCVTCRKFDKTSKKTIHNLPCLRYKLTTITMYRTGGLGLTKRFSDTEVKDVEIIGTPFIIEIIHGFRRRPMRLEIGRFKPLEGDVVTRRYGDGKEAHYAPFCLRSVEKTSEEFQRYLNSNAFAALKEAAQSEPSIIGRTLRMLMAHYNTLPDNPYVDSPGAKRGKNAYEQKRLLADAIRLWFAIRTGIGSAAVVTNVELLELERPDDDAPFQNENTVPRMIVAQFDAIRSVRVCQQLVPKVLKRYDGIITSKNTEAWFTIYLTTFLFLGLVSSASADRLRSARQKMGRERPETRYGPANSPLSSFVEELQRGGVILLLYWHYFKRVEDLMTFPWGDQEKRKQHSAAPYVKSLTQEQLDFLESTVNELRSIRGTIPREPSEGCWENSLFWISHMFESAPSSEYTWSPPETFSTIKPSVGRL